MEKKELSKLISYVEENTRTDKVSGIEFIDTRNFKDRVKSKQNYVIFGRRGAGKSSLLKTLLPNKTILGIYVNLEDYKDITFPNIILKVLIKFFEELNNSIIKEKKLFNFNKNRKINDLSKKVNKTLHSLKEKLSEPDGYEESRIYSESSKGELSAGTEKGPFKIAGLVEESETSQREHTWKIDKLNELKMSIDGIKSVVKSIYELTGKQVVLILDDFYFISKSIQPYLADYFHRITKSNNFHLKIGTINHRTNLYQQTKDSYVGMELNADIYDIDLDYTLDKWTELKSFCKELLLQASKASKANVDFDQLFNDKSFEQLCLASGGVPRDFLVLFIKCCAVLNETKNRITVPDVREVAIQNFSNKKNSLKIDSLENINILENVMGYLQQKVFIEKRTNVFLIENGSLEKSDIAKHLIRELIDLRFLHIIDNNTSAAPSDGNRYSAFLLDVSLYNNGRPRNFREVEPDLQRNRDLIRSAPRITVIKIEESINEG